MPRSPTTPPRSRTPSSMRACPAARSQQAITRRSKRTLGEIAMNHRFARAQQLSIAAISGFCVLIAARTVHAQSAEAESLFVEGDKLMKAGKLAQACESFDASNRIEARAGTLIRLGECREQNHQLASAWSAYKDALTRVKDPNKRAIATAKVAELEPKLSYLTITVPIANRVDQLTVTRNDKPFDAALWNRTLPIDGG